MTQTRTVPPTTATETRERRAWPLTAAAAGLCGVVATLVLDGRGAGSDEVSLSPQLFEDLDPLVYRASMVVGYLAVVLLLVTAAHLVPLGLLASAAGLTYGYGWKGALGDYMPGGMEHGMYDDQGLYVYYLLNDFGAYIGWLGVVVAAGAVAWMAFRERTVSRWIGVVSVVPVLQTTLMVVGMGVPGVAALLGPLWLVVAGLGLSLGRSTVVR
jgi:hypothetical protein